MTIEGYRRQRRLGQVPVLALALLFALGIQLPQQLRIRVPVQFATVGVQQYRRTVCQ